MRRIEILNKSYQNPNLHVPIAELNDNSLHEFFINSNLVSPNETVKTYGNNTLYYITKDLGTVSLVVNHKYYDRSTYNTKSPLSHTRRDVFAMYPIGGSNRVVITNNVGIGEYLVDYIQKGIWENIWATESSPIRKYATVNPTSLNFTTNDWIYVKDNYLIDLTAKSLGSIDINRLEYWYTVFRYYAFKEVIPGFNYPALYIPTEPSGLGNRYNILQLNKTPYGQELEFDNVQLNLLFGLSRNAYDAFKLLMEFIIDNECILEYDYGQGVRYTDVRLINAPKTEMEQGKIIRSKFDFKRITPFYTILQGSTVEVLHTHDWKIKPIVEGTVNTNTVYIEAEDLLTTEMITVKFDFTSVTKPFNFYYNAETKQILINGVNIGYKYIDLAYGKTFLELEKDIHYEVTTTGITNPVVTIKKWVID